MYTSTLTDRSDPMDHSIHIQSAHRSAHTSIYSTSTHLHVNEITHSTELKKAQSSSKTTLYTCSYPAGFVYIYSLLYYMTTNGENIVLAQALFAILYLLNLTIVLMLYSSVARVSTNYHDVTYLTTSYLHMHMLSHTYIHVSHTSQSLQLPPYLLLFLTCTAYRIHSIFVLRMFNDPVAMFFLHCSLLFMIHHKWLPTAILFRSIYQFTVSLLLTHYIILFISLQA